MISYGCPNCHGSLYIEAYRAEQRRFCELVCINCARLWKAEQYGRIVAAHEGCCSLLSRERVERLCLKYIEREAPWALKQRVEESASEN